MEKSLIHVSHTFGAVYDGESRALVLGTMPSPKSREQGFYYAHPQNRFWSVLAKLYGEETPVGTESRKEFALRHKIALWDVLAECDICGASDSSIKNPIPNDISALLSKTNVKAIFTTGNTATRLYMKYIEPQTKIKAIALPSTSPANARCSFDELLAAYAQIKEYT